MREAIGATWIFGIVIAFIVLFTGYLAFSVNYAKAFTIKDQIVDILEKYSGPGVRSSSSSYSGPVLVEINDSMKNIRYSSKGSCYMVGQTLYKTSGGSGSDSISNHKKAIMGVTNATASIYQDDQITFEKSKSHNYCVIRQKQDANIGGDKDERLLGFSNYYVATFFSMNIEIINIHLNFFVSGQTKNISYPVDGFLTSD